MAHPLPSDLLDHCLTEVLANRATVEDCAAQYPAYPDLAQHLRAAQQLRALPLPTLAPATSARHTALLRQHLRPAPRPARYTWTKLLRQALVMSMVLMFAIGMGFGVAAAAPGSIPGDPLYGLKRALETAALTIPANRMEAYLTQSQQRLFELGLVVGMARLEPEQLQFLLADMTDANEAVLRMVAELPAAQRPAYLTALIETTARQKSALAVWAALVPNSLRGSFYQAQRTVNIQNLRASAWREEALQHVSTSAPY